MHQYYCAASQGNMMGSAAACTCHGLFHTQTNSAFSMLFSVPNQYNPYEYDHIDADHIYSSSSSSVDCTLSLGTPSTRLTENQEQWSHHQPRRSSVSSFCWDLFHSNSKHTSQTKKPSDPNNNNNGNTNDNLVARRCANCDTTSTPLWRNGPRGPKSLCNACGIRFKKEERRASAAAATNGGVTPGGGINVMDSQHHGLGYNNNNSWYSSHNHKIPCFSQTMGGSEFRFVDGSDSDAENGIPFLSWRLNVTDRPNLVHDFTRS